VPQPHVDQPLVLLTLVALAPVLALVSWRRGMAGPRARFSLACRLVISTLLVLALAGLSIRRPVDRQAVVFVGDVSASVQDARLQSETFIRQAVAAKRPDDVYAVVTAGRRAAVERVLAASGDFERFQNPQPADTTDLADGLRLAGTVLPAAYRGRVVLLSDGQETSGDAAAQAQLLRARGAEVDVVPLPTWSGPEVLVDGVAVPAVVHADERFSLRVQLASNVATSATVRVFVDGGALGEQAVDLHPGATDLTFGARLSDTGLHEVRAVVEAAQDTLAVNNEARAVVEVQGPPRVLVVEQRPGEGANVVSALSGAGMRVETRPPADLPAQPDALGAFAAVVLADVSADSLDEAQQAALRGYVRDLGHGLLAIGGDSSYGQGGYLGTPLDDLLPVRSSVRGHRDQGRVALVLVIDRSGSMADDPAHEGTTKMAMAHQAAVLAADRLAPRDLVGVLAFDSTPQWVVPITSISGIGLPALEQKIGALDANGGTEIYPALAAAFEAIRPAQAQYKHVILLTDGMSQEGGDYAALLDRMRAANVTLSTVAIGGDADQQLLSRLAEQGDGRYYFADHARDIPRLVTRETRLATSGPLVQGVVSPRQVAPDATLAALASGGLPPLSGYLVTTPKDLAEKLLVSDDGDPLLARWQYGLGRTVAWTSDLRGRWSDAWVRWPGTPQLFAALVDWAIPPPQGPLRVDIRADAASAHVVVQERQLGPGPAQVGARVGRPGEAPLDVGLTATAPGRYEGEFPIGPSGMYRVRVEERRDGAVAAAAETGFPVSYAAEYRHVSADPQRLERIARAGGGHVLGSPAAAFADDLPPMSSPLPLDRALLLLAAALLPIDVALRRLRVSPAEVRDWLRQPRRSSIPVHLGWPWAAAGATPPAAAWAPGRPARWLARARRSAAGQTRLTAGPATPALAREAEAGTGRETEPGAADEDALGETLRWLRARRGN